METKKVAIIMGSDSDWPCVKGAAAQLKAWDIPFEVHVMSAHRTPAAAAAFAQSAADKGFGVIIAAAGMDALLATVQMPSGIPVATVALNGAKNAAVLAAQMLAIHDGRIAGLLKQARADMEKDIAAKDEKLQAEIAAL